MLADKIDGYRKQEERLLSEFKKHFNIEFIDHNVKREVRFYTPFFHSYLGGNRLVSMRIL